MPELSTVCQVALADYELYMPLLEAMEQDLEETLAENSDAQFFVGRSLVVNRFLNTLRGLMGEEGGRLPLLDESAPIPSTSVFALIQRYHVAFLAAKPLAC
ncbi:hypothetical protein AB4876_09910 [Zhongshania guokunii]|uniref:Uncharacterized protein n=1 Tax=Zhongshania guokunii TaxID=641783 RepID=A0ABV3U5P4_9GAMM